MGIPFLYSFTSMLVIGTGRDAAYVVERIAGRRGRRDRVSAAAGSKPPDRKQHLIGLMGPPVDLEAVEL